MAWALPVNCIPAFRYIFNLSGFKKPDRLKDTTSIRARK